MYHKEQWNLISEGHIQRLHSCSVILHLNIFIIKMETSIKTAFHSQIADQAKDNYDCQMSKTEVLSDKIRVVVASRRDDGDV